MAMFKVFVKNTNNQSSTEEKFMTVCSDSRLEMPMEDGPRKQIFEINPNYLNVQPNHTEADVLTEYATQNLFWDR